jgi:hypothetical protein
MEEQAGVKQPLLGIIGLIVCVMLAIAIMVWFKTPTFMSWFTFIIICAIPSQVVIGIVWQSNYPAPAATLAQPLKGLYLLLLTFLAGAGIAGILLKVVPGFKMGAPPLLPGPGPVMSHYIILTVVIALWLVIAWQCWPTAAIKGHPAFVGIGTVILTYIVTWIVFKLFWNFGVMAKAPFYVASADPGGMFIFANAMAFAVTTVVVLLGFVLLDMWPLSTLPPKIPAMAKPPVWGIVMSIIVLIITYIIYKIGLAVIKDPTVFLVKITISWIFGEFIMLNCMQTAPFQTVAQPLKGILLIISAFILALIMYPIYGILAGWIAGPLPMGAKGGYLHELWIASAMLAVTFPMFVTYTGYFNFWPFTEGAPPPPPEAAAPSGPAPSSLEESVSQHL